MPSEMAHSLTVSDDVEYPATLRGRLAQAQGSDGTLGLKVSTLVSRNVTVADHRTSCRMEPYMWDSLHDICARERLTIHALCTMISERKDEHTSLTAAIRVFALAYYRVAATEDGHVRVEHGHGHPFAQTPFEKAANQ